MPSVIIYDEATHGTRSEALRLDFLTDRITARELIRKRVYEEVQEFHLHLPASFRGLVQPRGFGCGRDGHQLGENRTIDWEEQYRRAVEAFESHGFLLLVDDRQVESLDEEIQIRADTEVSFLKLMPLIGG